MPALGLANSGCDNVRILRLAAASASCGTAHFPLAGLVGGANHLHGHEPVRLFWPRSEDHPMPPRRFAPALVFAEVAHVSGTPPAGSSSGRDVNGFSLVRPRLTPLPSLALSKPPRSRPPGTVPSARRPASARRISGRAWLCASTFTYLRAKRQSGGLRSCAGARFGSSAPTG